MIEEPNINEMSLTDLTILKSFIEKRLEATKKRIKQARGVDYKELCKWKRIYENSKYHTKLDNVNKAIEKYIDLV